MLRKVFWIFFLLLAAGKPARAQDMDAFTHQLLFNIFTGRADTAINGFLKLYVPVLYEQKRNAGDWTRYPAADSAFMRTKKCMHLYLQSIRISARNLRQGGWTLPAGAMSITSFSRILPAYSYGLNSTCPRMQRSPFRGWWICSYWEVQTKNSAASMVHRKRRS
jgi:hypothetical protein